MFEKLKIFLQESRQELKRVNWPSREETTRYTIFVIVFSISLSLFLGLVDFIFLRILSGVLF
ncbi:MAG: preprotein translocase subunit SecE [Patescibacteria group bacterium]